MASNRGNQGGGNQGGSNQGGNGGNDGGSDRGFAGMSDEEQRRIAQKGGEASARTQERDEQGQFDGTRSSGGGSNKGQGNQGGSNR
jgi:hypothetical protein